MGGDDPMDELNHLTELVGPELAGMVTNPSVAQPVKNASTSSAATSSSSNASEMPSDISDLRSSDLLQSLSGVDIDRMFADFQAEHNQQEVEAALILADSACNISFFVVPAFRL